MDKLLELISKCKCHISLEINEHRNYYATVKETLDELNSLECPPSYDEEIKNKMIKWDTIISLQFYPITPIGFYSLLDSDLDSILTRALNCLKEENK